MDQSRKFLIAVIFALVLASCGTVQEATLVDGDSVESLAFASGPTEDGVDEAAESGHSEAEADEEGDDDVEPTDDTTEDESDQIAGPPNVYADDSSDDDDDSQDDSDDEDTTSSTSTSTSPTTIAPTTTTAAPTTTATPTTIAPATTQPRVTTTTRAPTTTTTTRPPATTAAPTTTNAAPSTGESAVEAAASNEIFRLVNCARTASSDWCQPGDDANWNPTALANERPGTALTRSAALDTTSIAWSKQLTNQAFAHSPRSGIDYGENVAYYGRSTTGASITPDGAIAAATTLMDQWMNSPDHRTNLLRSSYTTMGVGIAYDVEAQSFAIYGTQQFS